MANVQHLDVYSGEDRTMTLYARDSANAAADLTGKTIAWYIGRTPWRPDNSNAIITKTGTIATASAGTFTVTIAASDTDLINGDYEHMAKTTDGSSNIAVVCQGRFRIRPSLVT